MINVPFTSEAQRAWNETARAIWAELIALGLDERNALALREAARVAFERSIRSGKTFGEAAETARYAASLG